MRIDWRALVRSRWTWVAAAGGGLVGLVVLLRRRGQGGAATPPSEEAPGYGPGGTGYYDSTATDVASQLSQAQAAWERTFDEFGRYVELYHADINRRLAEALAAGPETPPPPPPPPSTPVTPPPTQTPVITTPPPVTPPTNTKKHQPSTSSSTQTYGSNPQAALAAVQAYRTRTGR